MKNSIVIEIIIITLSRGNQKDDDISFVFTNRFTIHNVVRSRIVECFIHGNNRNYWSYSQSSSSSICLPQVSHSYVKLVIQIHWNGSSLKSNSWNSFIEIHWNQIHWIMFAYSSGYWHFDHCQYSSFYESVFYSYREYCNSGLDWITLHNSHYSTVVQLANQKENVKLQWTKFSIRNNCYLLRVGFNDRLSNLLHFFRLGNISDSTWTVIAALMVYSLVTSHYLLFSSFVFRSYVISGKSINIKVS